MITQVRPYRPDDPRDRAGVDAVCVRTGAAGGDARGRWSSDDLLPDLFARPYVDLEPETASVLDVGGDVVGYVVGTTDTSALVARWRERWLPVLRRRWDPPPEPPLTPEQRLLAGGWHPERMLRPELAAYPAHLHVDIVAEHRGRGHGRALLETFLAAAARAGAPGVHLGVDPANTGALAFYARIGLHRIAVPSAGSHYLGRAL